MIIAREDLFLGYPVTWFLDNEALTLLRVAMEAVEAPTRIDKALQHILAKICHIDIEFRHMRREHNKLNDHGSKMFSEFQIPIDKVLTYLEDVQDLSFNALGIDLNASNFSLKKIAEKRVELDKNSEIVKPKTGERSIEILIKSDTDETKSWNDYEKLKFIKWVHDYFGHFGTHFTIKFIQNYLQKNIVGLSKFVDKVLKSCDLCLRINSGKAVLIPAIVRTFFKLFEVLYVDFFEPGETSKYGNRYVCNIVCEFSSFAQYFPQKKKSQTETIPSLLTAIGTFGIPILVKFDQAFDTKLIKETFELLKIVDRISISNNHTQNSIVERRNATARNTIVKLAKALGGMKYWCIVVKIAQLMDNLQIRAKGEISPFTMAIPGADPLGNIVKMKEEDLVKLSEEDVKALFEKFIKHFRDNLIPKLRDVKENSGKIEAEQINDLRKKNEYKIGEFCYLLNNHHISPKSDEKYIGAFRIVDKLANHIYVIEDHLGKYKVPHRWMKRCSPNMALNNSKLQIDLSFSEEGEDPMDPEETNDKSLDKDDEDYVEAETKLKPNQTQPKNLVTTKTKNVKPKPKIVEPKIMEPKIVEPKNVQNGTKIISRKHKKRPQKVDLNEIEIKEVNGEKEIEELIREIECGFKELELNSELSPAPECGEIIFSTKEL